MSYYIKEIDGSLTLIANVGGGSGGGSTDQVQSDWNATNTSHPAYIKNKPDLTEYLKKDELDLVIPTQPTDPTIAEQIQSDWEETTTTAVSYIKNKPDLDLYRLVADSYTKNETYTKEEVNELVSTIGHLTYEVVSALPTHDISTVTIYLLAKSGSTGNNIYEEWLYVNNKWELIGSTEVDLTNYYTKDEVDTTLDNYVKTEDIPEQVQADWEEETETAKAFILNKPDLSIYAQVTDLNDYLPLAGGEVTGTVTSTKEEFTDDNEFVTKKYVDENGGGGASGGYLPLAGGTMRGNILMKTNKITAQDGTNIGYSLTHQGFKSTTDNLEINSGEIKIVDETNNAYGWYITPQSVLWNEGEGSRQLNLTPSGLTWGGNQFNFAIGDNGLIFSTEGDFHIYRGVDCLIHSYTKNDISKVSLNVRGAAIEISNNGTTGAEYQFTTKNSSDIYSVEKFKPGQKVFGIGSSDTSLSKTIVKQLTTDSNMDSGLLGYGGTTANPLVIKGFKLYDIDTALEDKYVTKTSLTDGSITTLVVTGPSATPATVINGGVIATTNIIVSGDIKDRSGNSFKNVQSDWTDDNETLSDGTINYAYIKNKPTGIVTNETIADGSLEVISAGTVKEGGLPLDQIYQKIIDVDPITGDPILGEMNVQSDWAETDTTVDSYIKNKPTNLITRENLTDGSIKQIVYGDGDENEGRVTVSSEGVYGNNESVLQRFADVSTENLEVGDIATIGTGDTGLDFDANGIYSYNNGTITGFSQIHAETFVEDDVRLIDKYALKADLSATLTMAIDANDSELLNFSLIFTK